MALSEQWRNVVFVRNDHGGKILGNKYQCKGNVIFPRNGIWIHVTLICCMPALIKDSAFTYISGPESARYKSNDGGNTK